MGPTLDDELTQILQGESYQFQCERCRTLYGGFYSPQLAREAALRHVCQDLSEADILHRRVIGD